MREDGSFAYLNQKALDVWGYNEDEATHFRVPDVDTIYNDEALHQLFSRAQTEVILHFETLHKRKEGTVFPVEVNVNAITLNGEAHLFAVARDINAAKVAEDALRESIDRYRNLIKQSPVAIALTRGSEFVFESINEPMLQMMNKLDNEDVLGKKLLEVLPEFRPATIQDFTTCAGTR